MSRQPLYKIQPSSRSLEDINMFSDTDPIGTASPLANRNGVRMNLYKEGTLHPSLTDLGSSEKKIIRKESFDSLSIQARKADQLQKYNVKISKCALCITQF